MIPIRLTDLILLCMIPGLLTVGGLWVFSVWRDRARDRLLRELTVRCRICSCVYTPNEEDSLSQCPSCHSTNERTPLKMI